MPVKNNVYNQNATSENFLENMTAHFRHGNYTILNILDSNVPQLPFGNYNYIVFATNDFSQIYNAIAFGLDYASGVFVYNKASGNEWTKIV